ncbi:MAG: hypothetical protein ACR2N4_08075 [Jatrophihabitans sp.]
MAATVITASTIGLTDVPPHGAQRALVSPTSSHPSSRPVTISTGAGPIQQPSVPSIPRGTISLAWSEPAASPARSSSTGRSANPSSVPTSSSSTAAASATRSSAPATPAGNAVIYVTGYDQATARLQYEFATVQPGAGPGGSDLYSVSSPAQFSARIAVDVTITSGGQLCPPASSSCSIDQLIAAASAGFYATAAIDQAGQLDSVIEVDNLSASPQLGPSPGPSLSTAPAPSTSPQS